MILKFSVSLKPHTKMLFSAPEQKKAVLCLMEKIQMLDKLLQLGVCCEFSVNE